MSVAIFLISTPTAIWTHSGMWIAGVGSDRPGALDAANAAAMLLSLGSMVAFIYIRLIITCRQGSQKHVLREAIGITIPAAVLWLILMMMLTT